MRTTETQARLPSSSYVACYEGEIDQMCFLCSLLERAWTWAGTPKLKVLNQDRFIFHTAMYKRACNIKLYVLTLADDTGLLAVGDSDSSRPNQTNQNWWGLAKFHNFCNGSKLNYVKNSGQSSQIWLNWTYSPLYVWITRVICPYPEDYNGYVR